MKLLINASIFFLFFSFKALSNENISKLNSLYLNGVLDKDTYFNSIEGLGIDTSNQIFINLFDLFTTNVLDIDSYENSLSNLISVKNNSDSVNIEKQTSPNSDKDLKSKTYVFDICQGDSIMCNELDGEKVTFHLVDNSIEIDQSFFDLVLQDPKLLRVNFIKTFTKNDDFDILTQIQHIDGYKIDFVFGGTRKNSQFEMIDMTLKGNGSEIIFTKLKLS